MMYVQRDCSLKLECRFSGLFLIAPALCSTLTRRDRIDNAAVVGVIFSTVGWVLSFTLPTTLLDPPDEDSYMGIGRSLKLTTSLLPNTGLYWCYRLISFFEGQGEATVVPRLLRASVGRLFPSSTRRRVQRRAQSCFIRAGLRSNGSRLRLCVRAWRVTQPLLTRLAARGSHNQGQSQT